MKTVNNPRQPSYNQFSGFPKVPRKPLTKGTDKTFFVHALNILGSLGSLFLHIKVYRNKTQSIFTYVCFIYIGFSKKGGTGELGNFYTLKL